MGSTLEAMRKLQDIQLRLAAFQADNDQKKRQIQIHRRTLQRQENVIEQERATILQTQLEIDRIDLDVKTKEQALSKQREALNRAKSNKEYAAILTVINTEKADNLKLENRGLHLLNEMDTLREKSDKFIAEREAILKRISEAQKKFEEFETQTASERQQLLEQRDAAAGHLPSSVVATFDRVAARHGGQAMAQVARLHPKRADYSCGGCNMSLTLEQINGLKTRDEIQVCGACGMILYLDSSDEGPAVKRR